MYFIEASAEGLTWRRRSAPLDLADATRLRESLERDQARLKIVNLEHRREDRPEFAHELFRVTQDA